MDLFKFVKKVEENTSMQEEVKACSNGEEFLNWLKKYHVEYLYTEFKKRSRDFGAEYWPWKYMSRIKRNKFFQ